MISHVRQLSHQIHTMSVPRACLALPFLYMGVIFLLSSIQGDGSPATVDPITGTIKAIIYNGAHVPLFALLAWLWCWSLTAWNITLNKRLILAFCLTAIYGVSDEWHQSFTPGRDTSFLDVMLDMLGASLAVYFYRGQQVSANG
ncbi:MAG: VanZ family protein [Gammaproteobacteria bacterium]|nr:VanZ family protein [Gammaproteobacteria bacterium]